MSAFIIQPNHFGALLALIASCCWAFAPFFFASAVRRIGPYYANFWRLIMASAVLSLIALGTAAFVPEIGAGVNVRSVALMAVSGVTGLVIGDFFYFKALSLLGPRRTLQILSAVPIVSALGAFLFLSERLSIYATLGITLAVASIMAVNWFDRRENTTAEPGSFSYAGVALAVLAAVCHGAGAVIMRKVYLDNWQLNTVAATAIRISSAGLTALTVALLSGKFSGAAKAVPSAHAFGRLVAGTAFGPVIGMLFYIASLKFAQTGIASTMSSLSPVLIVLLTAWRYKTPLNIPALISMLAAAGGVALIFYR